MHVLYRSVCPLVVQLYTNWMSGVVIKVFPCEMSDLWWSFKAEVRVCVGCAVVCGSL